MARNKASFAVASRNLIDDSAHKIALGTSQNTIPYGQGAQSCRHIRQSENPCRRVFQSSALRARHNWNLRRRRIRRGATICRSEHSRRFFPRRRRRAPGQGTRWRYGARRRRAGPMRELRAPCPRRRGGACGIRRLPGVGIERESHGLAFLFSVAARPARFAGRKSFVFRIRQRAQALNAGSLIECGLVSRLFNTFAAL